MVHEKATNYSLGRFALRVGDGARVLRLLDTAFRLDGTKLQSLVNKSDNLSIRYKTRDALKGTVAYHCIIWQGESRTRFAGKVG